MLRRAIAAASGLAYRQLGPARSTRLALGPLGRLAFRLLRGGGGGLAVYPAGDGLRLLLTREEALTSGIAFLGVLNPYETRLLRARLRPGDTFIDVGAYVDGWHSLVAAKAVGETGRVYTFEPLYAERFLQNVRLNGAGNVTVEALAVSDRGGAGRPGCGGAA